MSDKVEEGPIPFRQNCSLTDDETYCKEHKQSSDVCYIEELHERIARLESSLEDARREGRLEGIKLSMNSVAYYRDTRDKTGTGSLRRDTAIDIYSRLESLHENWLAKPAPAQRQEKL